MRLVVFSDTHGHCYALDAVLNDLSSETYDGMVCLGDAIQGGPQPVETVARLRELACPVVMGNADAWLLSGEETGAESFTEERLRQLNAVRDWQLTKLSPEDLAFIRTFQPTYDLPLEGDWKLRCYHGSPKSFDDTIFPLTTDEEVWNFLDPQPHTLYCGGHTHVQLIRNYGQIFHFNPGSVGLAYYYDMTPDDRRVNPWAEYAVLTMTKSRTSLEFRRVPYPVTLAREIYLASGRPYAQESAALYQG